MARYLSLYRRRPNLVDINLQSGQYAPMAVGLGAGKVALSYDFYVAANFDTASPTFFQNVPASGGYRSPTAQDPIAGFDSEQFSQSRTPYLTRFKFNPADYITGGAVNTAFTTAGVSDLTPLWITFIQRNVDGTTNSATAPWLILPFSSQPNRPILLSGTAPSGIGSVIEIQLPLQCDNIQVQNNSTGSPGAYPLMVAFEIGGPYFTTYPAQTNGLNLYETYPAASQMFVYGVGGTCAFNVIAALRNNPL